MRKIIIALVALLTAINANAQLGVVAGLTSSASTLDAAYKDRANITQYHAGITYKLGIGNIIAIQPSLIYNMKGSQLAGVQALGVEAFSVDYKTGYLELPVQLQLGLGIGSLARVYGFAEPYVGYAITNEINTKTIIGVAFKPEDKWQGVKNRLEYGVGLGAGVEIFRHLQVSVKYFWNFGNLFDSETTNIDFEEIKATVTEKKCNGVAASVAFLF